MVGNKAAQLAHLMARGYDVPQAVALTGDFGGGHKSVRNLVTLLTAQRVSEEIKENARKQGESVVKEAELQADRLLELAQARAHEVERGILELRAHRTGLRTDIRALITRLTSILDLQEEAEVEDNLRFLKRREEA